jgi:N-methylhydantoinase A
VTDAQLVLGLYDKDLRLGGEIALDQALAEEAVSKSVAEPLGLGVVEAAAGIVRLVDTHIVHALRAVSVERGRDPRRFALVAFGGAGPAHAVAVARQLGITRVLVPPIPGCNSALGILNTDVRHEMVEAFAARLHDVEPTTLGKVVDELATEATAELAADGVAAPARSLHLSLDLRYRGQAHELTIPLAAVDVSAASIRTAIADFHATHRARYGHALDDDLVEIVNVRVTGIGTIPKAELRAAARLDTPLAHRARRTMHLPESGSIELPVYDRTELRHGDELESPCIVHQLDATTLVPPGCRATVHPTGTLVIEI